MIKEAHRHSTDKTDDSLQPATPCSATPRSADAKRQAKELKKTFMNVFTKLPVNSGERQSALEYGQQALAALQKRNYHAAVGCFKQALYCCDRVLGTSSLPHEGSSSSDEFDQVRQETPAGLLPENPLFGVASLDQETAPEPEALPKRKDDDSLFDFEIQPDDAPNPLSDRPSLETPRPSPGQPEPQTVEYIPNPSVDGALLEDWVMLKKRNWGDQLATLKSRGWVEPDPEWNLLDTALGKNLYVMELGYGQLVRVHKKKNGTWKPATIVFLQGGKKTVVLRLKGKESATPFLIGPDDAAAEDGAGVGPIPDTPKTAANSMRSALPNVSPIMSSDFAPTPPSTSDLLDNTVGGVSTSSTGANSSVREEILEFEKLDLLRRLRTTEQRLAKYEEEGVNGSKAGGSHLASGSSLSPAKQAGAGILVTSATSVVQSAVEDVAEMHRFTQELLGKLEVCCDGYPLGHTGSVILRHDNLMPPMDGHMNFLPRESCCVANTSFYW
eukprot:SAG31_NODE_2495_length_5606_cov_5.934084_3_plen_499_part_00